MRFIKNIILLTAFSVLPMQGFCDLFWVCSAYEIQETLNYLQNNDCRVMSVETNVLNEMCTSYTIRYRN
jgi:hypothetical protein